jgi:hypothetical protein
MHNNYSDEKYAKYISLVEIKALFVLLYLAGVLRSSHLNLVDLWAKDGTGVEMFRAVMTLQRFKFLLRLLRFYDVTDHVERR